MNLRRKNRSIILVMGSLATLSVAQVGFANDNQNTDPTSTSEDYDPSTADEDYDPSTADEDYDPSTADEDYDPSTADEDYDPSSADEDSDPSSTTDDGSGQWIYVPASPNVQRGDVIVTKKEGSVVTLIMEALGNFWDHMLVALDDQGNFRHNTFDETTLTSPSSLVNSKSSYKFFKCSGIAYTAKNIKLPRKIDANKLGQGAPGIENTTRRKGSNRALLTVADEADRELIEEVASEMEKLNGHYILHSFVDMHSYVPTTDPALVDKTTGGQCSSTVWWASKNAGMEMNNPIIEDSEIIRLAVENTYSKLSSMIKKELENKINDTINHSMRKKPGILLDSTWRVMKRCIKGWAMDKVLKDYKTHTRIANQVVNTFLFNRPDDTSDYWRNHYQEVYIDSFSPSHLLMAGMQDVQGRFNGMQTAETSYYNAITDYTESGGYYVKLETGKMEPLDDPRLSDETGKMIVVSADRMLNPLDRTYNSSFEPALTSETAGDGWSKRIEFEIKNRSLSSELKLVGSPIVQVAGNTAFQIIEQPEKSVLQPAESVRFTLELTLPQASGSHTATVSIPNDDAEDAEYSFLLKIGE